MAFHQGTVYLLTSDKTLLAMESLLGRPKVLGQGVVELEVSGDSLVRVQESNGKYYLDV